MDRLDLQGLIPARPSHRLIYEHSTESKTDIDHPEYYQLILDYSAVEPVLNLRLCTVRCTTINHRKPYFLWLLPEKKLKGALRHRASNCRKKLLNQFWGPYLSGNSGEGTDCCSVFNRTPFAKNRLLVSACNS